MARMPYLSDLTDEQWEILSNFIPPAKPGGRPRSTDMREVLNSLLYQNRTGCQWEMLPHDLLPKSTVHEYYAQWIKDGTWQSMLDVLRQGLRGLVAHSGEPTPSAASIDSQSVKAAGMRGERGYDGGKKISGRKRHIVVDALRLQIAVVVTGAGVDDATAASQVLKELRSDRFPRLEVVWADQKYHNHELNEWLKRKPKLHPWMLEIETTGGNELLRAVAEMLSGGADTWRRAASARRPLPAECSTSCSCMTISDIRSHNQEIHSIRKVTPTSRNFTVN